MTSKPEFDGDQCIVLSKDYLQSAQAASEIYEDDLAKVAGSLDIDNLTRKRGFLHGTVLATLFWLIPSVWNLCQ
jgi:hypothetical protein